MVLPPEVVELIDSLRREIEALRAENAELRRRLGLDSSNSSKPPSSDGLKKKPRVLKSLRTRSGKPSGGQKGHRGDTLRQVAEPDAIVEHAAEVCEHCRALLLADSKIGEEKRQVFDLPEKPLIVTEHRAAIHDCPACGLRTRAGFPEGVVSPAQYGERVKAAAVYLNAQQLVPEERTAQVLQDLFGAAAACGASVAAWVRRKAGALAPVHRGIGACVAGAPVRCLDETGLRIAGATRWLHTASTLTHTFYRAGEPRSAVPEFEGGVVVHDHWRAYLSLETVDHAFCNAHLLRELQAVCELDKEPWAEALRATLLDADEAVRTAKAQGASALPAETIKAFEDRYWAAVREGLALHRSLPGLRSLDQPEKAQEAAARSQSPHPVQDLQGGDPQVPHRLHRSLHQQPCRTRFEDDEGEDQNLGRLPNPARRRRLRKPALRDLVGQKAGPQHPQSPDPRPRTSRRRTEALTPGFPSTPIRSRTNPSAAPVARNAQHDSRLGSYAGANSYRQMLEFIRIHLQRMNEAFGLGLPYSPSYTGLRLIIRGVDPVALEAAFRKHASSISTSLQTSPGLTAIAVDGKTLRGSFDAFSDRKAAHMMSALRQADRIVLGHLMVEAKSNEIPAAPDLIEALGVKGCMFTLDAEHTQKNI